MQNSYGVILENEDEFDFKLKNNLILDIEIALFWRRSYGLPTKVLKEGNKKYLYWADYSTEKSSTSEDIVSELTDSE